MMLTDEEIEKLAKPYITSLGDYWCSEKAIPDNGKIEDFARAAIAANNAKVLADLKPDDSDINEVHEGSVWNAADQVSALIQRNAELEANLKEVRALAPTRKVLEQWEAWAYSEHEDEGEQNLSDALRDIRASEDCTEAALKQVLLAVQEYLPPDGITKDDFISRVIACVDPWPTEALKATS